MLSPLRIYDISVVIGVRVSMGGTSIVRSDNGPLNAVRLTNKALVYNKRVWIYDVVHCPK